MYASLSYKTDKMSTLRAAEERPEQKFGDRTMLSCAQGTVNDILGLKNEIRLKVDKWWPGEVMADSMDSLMSDEAN